MSRVQGPAKPTPWRLLKRSGILARSTMPEFTERDGEAFFQTGRSIVSTLRNLAASLRQSRWDDVQQFYSSRFLGKRLHLDGALRAREVVLGDGYGSQSSLRLHFGLKDRQTVDKLVVRWPRSGIVQTFANVAVNRIIQITEGDYNLVEKRYASPGR
jgi:hypothetical protein